LPKLGRQERFFYFTFGLTVVKTSGHKGALGFFVFCVTIAVIGKTKKDKSEKKGQSYL
jgi:hypothetical protein